MLGYLVTWSHADSFVMWWDFKICLPIKLELQPQYSGQWMKVWLCCLNRKRKEEERRNSNSVKSIVLKQPKIWLTTKDWKLIQGQGKLRRILVLCIVITSAISTVHWGWDGPRLMVTYCKYGSRISNKLKLRQKVEFRFKEFNCVGQVDYFSIEPSHHFAIFTCIFCHHLYSIFFLIWSSKCCFQYQLFF